MGGDKSKAIANFDRGFANVRTPFGVWSETPSGGTVNFLTGAGGFLQSVQFGLTGLRIWPDHLSLNPFLVDGMEEVCVRNVQYRGASLDITIDSKSISIAVTSDDAVVLTNSEAGEATTIVGHTTQQVPLGEYTIKPHSRFVFTDIVV